MVHAHMYIRNHQGGALHTEILHIRPLPLSRPLQEGAIWIGLDQGELHSLTLFPRCQGKCFEFGFSVDGVQEGVSSWASLVVLRGSASRQPECIEPACVLNCEREVEEVACT